MSDHTRCITCRYNRGDLDVLGGVIYRDALWCAEHASEPIPMVGWLVLKPMRHVEHFADLTEEEATTFGPLARRITQAMKPLARKISLMPPWRDEIW